ncbi:unnamed protein product [Ambrosiozyma monospora]|uniref:Unnamed protein product n=1 Tax=Ambrosiozyma monospora TaxID=43982 RepID=A0ACB5UBB2_AMBMO|nr:unnamed protein product [Ambrosiozyma monospora]
MKLHHSPRCYNGQIFPISVNFKNKGVDKYGLHMSVTAHVEGHSLKTKWNKDSEYSRFYNSDDLMETNGQSENTLYVYLPMIDDLPFIGQRERQELKIELRYSYLIDNNDEMAIEHLENFTVPVFEQFKLQFNISPALNSVIPSIFNAKPANLDMSGGKCQTSDSKCRS